MTHKPTDKSFGNTYLSVNTSFLEGNAPLSDSPGDFKTPLGKAVR